MSMTDTILEICIEAVRTHAKGSNQTAQEISECFQRTIPGTIQATIDSVKAGKWTPPARPGRRAIMAKAAPKDPPKK